MGTAGAGARASRWFVSLVVVVVLAVSMPATPVAAHGSIDQSTGGEAEACSMAEYPGSKLVTTEESRQSFVPNRGGLASVELCIQNLVGVAGTDFTVHIYEGDNPAAPGALLASQPFDAGSDLLANQWVHVDFADPSGAGEVPTTPGASYVIGVQPAGGVLSSVSFQWRATCNDGLLSSSCTGQPDRYPDGQTSDLPGNADYAFRTFPFHEADLVGAVTIDPAVCAGLDLAGRATGTVRNPSQTAVGSFTSQWVWSDDALLDAGDTVIEGSSHTIGGLAAGGQEPVPPPTLPSDLAYGDGHLLLDVDVHDDVMEADDANNVAAGSTTVTACGQPTLTGLDLTVVEDEVQAGFGELHFSDLDLDALATLPQSQAEVLTSPAFSPTGFSPTGFSPTGFSPNEFSSNGFSPTGFSPTGFSPTGFSPTGFSPTGFSPTGFSPTGFSPAAPVLLRTVLDDLPPGLTETMQVVNVPIVGDQWETRLTGLIDEPIQGVTLAEASALLPDLALEEVDLAPVLPMSWMSLALANGTLDDTPVDGGWCALIAGHGSTCAGLGVDPATTSLLGLESAGFPTHLAPIAGLPLSAIELNPAFLVMGFPLNGDRGFNLELTRLGQLAAEDALIDGQTVLDCDAFDCSDPLTLAASTDAFADVDVATLLAQLTPDALGATTVGDLAMGTASIDTLRLSAANWNLADVHAMDPECPRATYRLVGSNEGSGASVDPTATVTLATGFDYVAGSVSLLTDGTPAVAQTGPSTTVASDGTRTLTFDLDGEFSDSFELTFAACANVYLGALPVGAATMSGFGIDGPYDASTTATDLVRVVDRTPGVTTQAITTEDNVVIADHISEANAFDSWTFELKPEPGTLYIAKLFTPIGTDFDLLAYGPEHSANGFSPTGFSPTGFSPTGFSPTGFSPTGFSPTGFSPTGFSPTGFSPTGFSPTGFSDTATPALDDDVPVEELRPPGSSGVAVSANRWDTTESLYLVSRSGDAGRYTFSVADYNGSRSDAPYFLTIQTVRPEINPALAECAPAPWGLEEAPGEAPPVWTGAEPPETIFVTNRQVTASAHGPAEADAGIAALAELAGRPEVNGIVLNVDHDLDIRAAYAGWHDDWCDPTAANVVAASIRTAILDLRQQYPSIDTVVLAGDDALVPDFRLDDRSWLANEDNYTDALLKATGTNNALVAAYANGMIPSADPYGNEAPLPFGMSYAFPPSAGVSRLVETPADWIAQKDLYVLSDGALDPESGFVSAYDGMVDGAVAAADALEGGGLPTSLLTDADGQSWTAADFRQRALVDAPGASGWNGHANHWGLLSDHGSATDDISELVTTEELGGLATGTLVFSNGCHFGTAVGDLLNAAPTEAERMRLKDWADGITQRQGIAVANTGFGIFDTLEVGQGERLQAYFLEELDRADNVSLALARAKNRFFASPGVYDAYSYKTMHQLSVYGLGIFRMYGTSADEPPPPAPPATDEIDLEAGPYAVDQTGSSTCTDCYLLQETVAGTRVELRDSGVETGHTSTNGYWSAPLSTRAVPLPNGMASAGVWIDAIDSVQVSDRDPVLTRLAVDDPAHEVETQAAAPFPTALHMVNDVGGIAHVTLLHGILEPERKTDGRVVGDMHLYTDIDAQLLLMPENQSGCTPHIDEVNVARSDDGTLVLVDVGASELCGQNRRAGALARDSAGNWHTVALAPAANGHWTGSFTVSPDVTVEDLYAQVDSGRGVGQWRHKGDRPIIDEGGSIGVEIAVTGDQHATGVYLGATQVTILGNDGVSYRVYDNDQLIGTFGNGAGFTVSGDGLHDITIVGSDGSRAATTVAIDGSAPAITWFSPPAGAVYRTGDAATLDVRCSDGFTGASCSIELDGAPVANGSALPTDRVGQHTIVVTAVDGVDRVVTDSRTYTVESSYVIGDFYSPLANKPKVNRVNPGSEIPVKFDVYDAAGNEYSDPSIIAHRWWIPIDCGSKAATGPAFGSQGGTPEYSGFFHFNVSAPAKRGCYELVVELDDGSTKTAWFEVK